MEEIKISALARDKADEVHAAFARMDKPGANLGKLEDMVCSLAAMNGTEVPQSLKSAMLLMCGDHGIAKYGVSAYPQEVTLQMMNGYRRGTAAATVLARHAGADVFVVDVGTTFDVSHMDNVHHHKVAWGTEDFTGPCNDCKAG